MKTTIKETVARNYSISRYERGYIDGMTAYSHWNNGIEYVGTCGQTLDAATSLFLASKLAAEHRQCEWVLCDETRSFIASMLEILEQCNDLEEVQSLKQQARELRSLVSVRLLAEPDTDQDPTAP